MLLAPGAAGGRGPLDVTRSSCSACGRSVLIYAHLPGQPHSNQEQESSLLFHR